jgi:thiol-disulfide isomerase/thioredoxin
MDFGAKFEAGLSYAGFLEKYGSDEHRQRWQAVHDQVRLSESQQALLRSFEREMKVLVSAGAWCGDCVNQCPIFAHFAGENAKIRIRYFDRDEDSDLADAISTCGAPRVPSVLFLSEDNHVCGRYGDRTLTKYRQMIQDQVGLDWPTIKSPPTRTLLESVSQEWLNEFERIQLMLRTSGRLRQLHGD